MIPTCESDAKDRAALMSVWTLSGQVREYGRRQTKRDDHRAEHDGDVQQGADAQQQERPEVHRQGAIEHGARGGRPFHCPRQPARERDQRRFARGGNDQQHPDQEGLPGRHGRDLIGPGTGPQQLVKVAFTARRWCMTTDASKSDASETR